MFAQRHLGFCLLVFAAMLLAACHGAPNDNATASSAATASPAATASAAANPLEEHVATARYRIDVSYPALHADEAPLAAMLRRIAGAAKRDFLRSLPDPGTFPEFAGRQLQLRMDFKLAARTSEFTSARETGFQDTGGAHPAPIDAAIVYDIHAHRTITLDDLFSNPDAARRALADYARAELTKGIMAQAPKPGEGSAEALKEWKANAKQMIDHGTQPTQQNFANFIVRATDNPLDPSPGLMLIFPPYQVAAYVYGTQTVFAPTAVFAQLLKPQYRNAFGIPIVN